MPSPHSTAAVAIFPSILLRTEGQWDAWVDNSPPTKQLRAQAPLDGELESFQNRGSPTTNEGVFLHQTALGPEAKGFSTLATVSLWSSPNASLQKPLWGEKNHRKQEMLTKLFVNCKVHKDDANISYANKSRRVGHPAKHFLSICTLSISS